MMRCRHSLCQAILEHAPPNKPLNRPGNSSVQLTLGAVWRDTSMVGSEPVSAVASRLTPIRWAARRGYRLGSEGMNR